MSPGPDFPVIFNPGEQGRTATKYMAAQRNSLIILKSGENNMPDVTQAEVGRRLYHVHREKTVEGSIKLMQQGIGAEWRSFSEADVGLLLHLLQCTWNTIDQKVWDKIPFSKMTVGDVRQILAFGDGVGPGKNPSPESVAEIRKILLKKA